MRTALTRWAANADPARAPLTRMFEDAFNEMLRPYDHTEGLAARTWVPRVDIRENENSLALLMDLPGLRKEDVTITLENNVLTVAGERKFEAEEGTNENYHRLERHYGAFSRSFTLANTVQTDKVEATFGDGVLTIRLPKQEESKPRRITIG